MVKLNTMNMITEVKSFVSKKVQKTYKIFFFQKQETFLEGARVRGYDTKDIAKL